jgi:carbon-monoxide dehydrogenase medium subunit
MSASVAYLRPQSVSEVCDCLRNFPEAQLLAGGQSLLAAWRLGLCAPTHFVDLQDVPDLRGIRLEGAALWVGAMCTHAQLARSPAIAAQFPMIGSLAHGIADAQVRNVGTIAGALAHNDPAACWPAGVLALRADIVTNRRTLGADVFFQGLFRTALEQGEWILGVRFPRVAWARYLKFEQAASRFALVGVAVARTAEGHARVAITGLGHGVTRWPAAEMALSSRWSVHALDTLEFDASAALSDMHASAAYRAHLVAVLVRRAIAANTGESAAMPAGNRLIRSVAADAPAPHASPMPAPVQHRLHGSQLLSASPGVVWQHLLDPAVLAQCIPGCVSIQRTQPEHYQAVVKVGLGPVSATFETQVAVIPEPPSPTTQVRCCRLLLSGQAGALGEGKATVWVQLHPVHGPNTQSASTRLEWQATPEVSGKLAQLGNRLVDASANSLSQQFFARLRTLLAGGTAAPRSRFSLHALATTIQRWMQRILKR